MAFEEHRSEIVSTTPYDGQKPGTSGLRKPVNVFMSNNYTQNFVQSILDAINTENDLLIIGGDGRYYVQEAVQIIIKMCAANGVKRLIVGQNGIFSTPAVSNLIRKHKASGGIILTASHNPGGINGDFGIKYNCENGGPAPEGVTNQIYERTKNIKQYKICPTLNVDIANIGANEYKVDGNTFRVEVIDSVADYSTLMKEIFDFPKLKTYVSNPSNKILIDAMNGVMGPYAKQIFIDELGAASDAVVHSTPLPDFGGEHPDPNLTYAAGLVKAMSSGDYVFGAAFDGDGDRNMILGHKAFFVTPSDSLAVIAANIELIPYFKKTGVKGFARSMPTAGAVDQVARKLNKNVYEVPTGWKFFGNLMDSNQLSLCGEESFGTGSDHIREKDGCWAVLAWLTILANTQLSVEELVKNHWKTFGRNFFTRYDYENCDAKKCDEMIARMEKIVADGSLLNTKYKIGNKESVIITNDNFEYKDPVDHSVSSRQGIRILFDDGSRIVLRLSGTGSQGATVRLYVDCYADDISVIEQESSEVLKPLVDIAIDLLKIKEYTGRDKPTVIT
ncbi:Phosphoglucomutase-like protein [Dinothrombium tinctorium]|uniref:phosphoglucomutase (alpha-D-glucose-1,6-bisphosphate-dependent) n=1 Tax=Dinothrombium tinctorium TaxID=1965070 RepID=A0A443RP70_9ACAR|nr:Phosphoglucomutase-like protein [Dinothrombium tinctorium]